MNFNQFISRENDKHLLLEAKNIHLAHLEDEIFLLGVDGVRQIIKLFDDLLDNFKGESEKKVNITTKWDGAPAIITGINPENGKFFVATKSLFAKTSKINYTNKDIELNHGNSPGLVDKLKLALQYLSKLNIDGVVQGDVMFTQEDLRVKVYEGKEYLTFKPNTILYMIPSDSDLAKQMKKAKIGIVFHTVYTGDKIEDLEASFTIDVSKFKQINDVWFSDAELKDISGKALFTDAETAEFSTKVTQLKDMFNTLDKDYLPKLHKNQKLIGLINIFNNMQVKQNVSILDLSSRKYLDKLLEFIEERYSAEIGSMKIQKAIDKKIAEKTQTLDFLNTDEFLELLQLFRNVTELKLMVLKKLKSIKKIGTFVEDGGELKVTDPEGFVIVDRLTNNAVKLVDRLEFSRANFVLPKEWKKK